MVDKWGCHHSKIIVLFRRNKTAEIVIHTANMVKEEWDRYAQSVWKSPRLPLLTPTDRAGSDSAVGARFKRDFMAYIKAYGQCLQPLLLKLSRYDFSAVQAAFVASVPGRCRRANMGPTAATPWGWLGLEQTLSRIPMSETDADAPGPHIVTQVSTVSTLGSTPDWLLRFQAVLACSGPTAAPSPHTEHHIVFPTVSDLEASWDGLHSGIRICFHTLTPAQQKQFAYLQPLLRHWAPAPKTAAYGPTRALRGRTVPHSKTYIRFRNGAMDQIDWAMVTSANLSRSAWGGLESQEGVISIKNWEAGVVVWPALFALPDCGLGHHSASAVMVPSFGTDRPCSDGLHGVVVACRMLYDLPLRPWSPEARPWR